MSTDPEAVIFSGRKRVLRDDRVNLHWREYEPGDLARLTPDALFQEEIKSDPPAWMADGVPPGLAWTIERGQGLAARPVACAGLKPTGDATWALWAATDALTPREWAFAYACTHLSLALLPSRPMVALADPKRPRAQAFLERLGFEPSGEAEGQILMTRRLV